MRWYGTFGNGYSLKDNFVSFEAAGYDEAHKKMEEHYGNEWSNLYIEAAWKEGKCESYYPKGEVALGTKNEYLSGRKEEDSPADETDGYRESEPPLIRPEPAPQLVQADQVVGGGTDYSNEFMVEWLASGERLLIHRGPIGPLTPRQAYCLAAWLVVKADESRADINTIPFFDIFEAVENLHHA